MTKGNSTLDEQFEDGIFLVRHIPNPEEEKQENDIEQLMFDAMILQSKGKQPPRTLLTVWRDCCWRASMRFVRGILDGWLEEQAYEYAMYIIRTMIQEGNSLAMNELALLYYKGKGVEKSHRWAIHWFEKANANGCIEAKANLAQILILGPKKYRDDERGIRLLEESMNEGVAEAFNLMGICCNKGYGVERDAQKAFKMYSKAYELGAGPVCTANLANMYLKGLGVKPDIQKAKALFQEAKEGGHPIDEEIKATLNIT